MSNKLTLQEAALAWAQGKNVEAMQASSKWGLIIKPGCSSSQGVYYPNIFIKENCGDCLFRLATEPPAKRYRPWKPEEVPLDAWFIDKERSEIGFKLAYAALWSEEENPTVASANGHHHSLIYIFEKWKHSTDNGKTWPPCGVEVES